MKIDPKVQSDLQAQSLASRAVRDKTPADGTKAVAPATVDAPARGDRVELSTEARLLSRSGALTPERIQEIRQRIAAGEYDDAGTAESVARRILASGDV